MAARLRVRARRRLLCALAVALVAALVAFAGCSRPKRISSASQRVISLSPSTTETMFAIGAGNQLVGRSRYCDHPKEALALPQIGGYVDPNFEAILALRPDLVVGARGPLGPEIVSRLATHGIATFFPETESFPEIDAMILGIGARVGREAEARRVVETIGARVAAIAQAVASRPKKRVLLVFGVEPIVVAGPKSFPDEMLRRAGAENVIAEGASYPVVGIERLLALDPDLVLNAVMAETHGATRIAKGAAGWGDLRAVRDGSVVVLSDESVIRPGPRIAEGLAIVARAVHPEVSIP
jgi:iron complex transport system substrate-binding protein